MAGQLTKSLRDFAHRAAKLPFHRKQITSAPIVPLTIRVGIAGHLNLPQNHDLALALRQVLVAIGAYAQSVDPLFRQALFGAAPSAPPELRLVSQLASGFDQLAAETGLPLGYKLNTVLPGARDSVAEAVARNLAIPGGQSDAESRREEVKARFVDLLGKSERVIELDSDSADDFSPADYAQAGTLILDHSDLLVVALHPEADAKPGGTLWLSQRGEELALPTVRLKLGAIGESELCWTAGGRRQRCTLFDANIEGVPATLFGPALDNRLIAAGASPPTAGWFERGYAAQLEPSFNRIYWQRRWQISGADDRFPVLSRARNAIDGDFAAAKIWSDNRASAFAELLRGSFHVSALLGLLAIGGAAAGLLAHDYSIPGKLLELTCLSLVLFLANRSSRYRWRSQWIRIRQLERLIDRAAWLGLLGRSGNLPMPEYGANKQIDPFESWAQAYFQAIIRAASFPPVRLTPDYRVAAQTLIATNLVAGQIDYFAEECALQQKSHDSLTGAITGLVVVATTAVLIYLAIYTLEHFSADLFGAAWAAAHEQAMLEISHKMGKASAWLGILLPAVAAALAAMRSFGEYEQLAARYRGMRDALEAILVFLRGRLPDVGTDREIAPLRSAVLVRKTFEATAALAEETSGWGALFQGKDIEII
jgi:hypothetical protein